MCALCASERNTHVSPRVVLRVAAAAAATAQYLPADNVRSQCALAACHCCRVAENVAEEQESLQEEEARRAEAASRRRPRTKSSGTGGGSGGRGGRGRKAAADPHTMLNVDADPLSTDPGDLGRC